MVALCQGIDNQFKHRLDLVLSHPNQWRKHRDETKCEDCSRHHNANNCDKYLNNHFISFLKNQVQGFETKYNNMNNKITQYEYNSF